MKFGIVGTQNVLTEAKEKLVQVSLVGQVTPHEYELMMREAEEWQLDFNLDGGQVPDELPDLEQDLVSEEEPEEEIEEEVEEIVAPKRAEPKKYPLPPSNVAQAGQQVAPRRIPPPPGQPANQPAAAKGPTFPRLAKNR